MAGYALSGLLAIGVFAVTTDDTLAAQKQAQPPECGAPWFDFLLPGSPSRLEPFLARTAAQYILYSHVTRGLLAQALDGGLEGDLADSWKVSEDFTRFEFHLRKAKWSDGRPLTAGDVKRTFDSGMRVGATTHFDFGDIRKTGTKGDDVFWLTTKSPKPGFLRNLLVPETGILSEASLAAHTIADGHPISGAFEVLGWDGAAVMLRLSTTFENAVPSAPRCLRMAGTDKAELARRGRIDLAWMPTNMDVQSHEALMASGKVKKMKPPIAFTYFLAMNPDSKALADVELRRHIQSLLAPGRFDPKPFGPQYEPASQLYQHDGAGRPSKDWLDAFWQKITTRTAKPPIPRAKITLALSAVNAFHADIERRLKAAGIAIETLVWKDSTEYVKIAANPAAYDMILLNNDFSSVELLENLIVTFNPRRPYIKLAKDSPIHNLMSKAKAAASPGERYPLYEAIARNLLEEARIVPLAYEHVYLYRGSHVDVSRLSVVSPDVRVWRIALTP